MPFCTQCGLNLDRNQAFCTRCGSGLQSQTADRAPAPHSTRRGAQQPSGHGTRPQDNEVLFQMPEWARVLNDSRLRNRVLQAVTKSLLVNGSLTLLVVIPGLVLNSVSSLMGMLWMFAGSGLLVIRTYATPWKLMIISCLTPAIASVLGYGLQFWLFSYAAPPIIFLLLAGEAFNGHRSTV